MSLFKAKKHMASLMGDTKLGRKIVLDFVGDEGVQVIACMKSTALKVTDRKTAKELKHSVLKLAMKAGLLHKEKLLPFKLMKPVGRPIKNLATAFLQECTGKPAGKRDPTALVEGMALVHDLLLERFAPPGGKPLMREKNTAKLTRVFRYYGDRKPVISQIFIYPPVS